MSVPDDALAGGHCYIQDPSTAAACVLLDPKPGEKCSMLARRLAEKPVTSPSSWKTKDHRRLRSRRGRVRTLRG